MNNIEIKLNFDGHDSDVVVGMYIDSNMVDDIVQTGWNLCDCDDEKYNELVGDCVIDSSYVKKHEAEITLSLSGSDRNLIEKTIQDFLDNLGYLVRPTLLGLRSRTGENYEFILKESSFDLLSEN